MIILAPKQYIILLFVFYCFYINISIFLFVLATRHYLRQAPMQIYRVNKFICADASWEISRNTIKSVVCDYVNMFFVLRWIL